MEVKFSDWEQVDNRTHVFRITLESIAQVQVDANLKDRAYYDAVERAKQDLLQHLAADVNGRQLKRIQGLRRHVDALKRSEPRTTEWFEAIEKLHSELSSLIKWTREGMEFLEIEKLLEGE